MRPVDFNYKADQHLDASFHTHVRHEIYYFHEGKCNYVIGPHVYALQPGDLIIMHGMTMHAPNLDRRFPYVRSICHFETPFLAEYMNPSYIMPLLKPFEELRNYRIHTGSTQREIESVLAEMNRLYEASSDENGKYERFLLRFIDLLYVINDLCHKPMQNTYIPSSEKERHVQRIIDYIENHYSEDITLDGLEQELHLSKHYLARIFKEWTGTTIFHFLYHRRINQAKTLFSMKEHLSVSDAAKHVGFKHLAHFSRVFKQFEGCSPDHYRKKLSQHKII